eukprot:g8467.t1
MEQLLQKLSQRDLAAIFNQPVMASEYPDYHQIVSTPMDLGTIQENIRKGVYPSLEACAKDVRTVWTNAYLYNPAKSVVAQGARVLSKVFEGMYNKINPSDFNYAREPNVDERNKFSRDIYRVEDSQLAEAVGLLEQRCPGAVVRDNEEGYFVVKVDALPSPVFWEVELYLRKRLCNQPDRTKKKIPTTFRPPPESMARLGGTKRGIGGGAGDSAKHAVVENSGTPGGGAAAVETGSDGGGDKRRKTGDGAAADGGGATGTKGSSGVVGGDSASASSSTNSCNSSSGSGEKGGAPAGSTGGPAAGVEKGQHPKGSVAADETESPGHAGRAEKLQADTSFRETVGGATVDVGVTAAGAQK